MLNKIRLGQYFSKGINKNKNVDNTVKINLKIA